jgi:hypothetical protein
MGIFDIFRNRRVKKINAILNIDGYNPSYSINVSDIPLVRSAIEKISSTTVNNYFYIYKADGSERKEILLDSVGLKDIVTKLLINGYVTSKVSFNNKRVNFGNNGGFIFTLSLKNNYCTDGSEPFLNLENRLGKPLIDRLIKTEIFFNNFINTNTINGLFILKDVSDINLLGAEIEQFNNNITFDLSGFLNSFKHRAVPFNLDYLKIGINFDESGLKAIRDINREDVCNAFNIPSLILNDNEQSSYNNIREAYKRFYYDCINYYAELICFELNNSLRSIIDTYYKDGYIYFKNKELFSEFGSDLIKNIDKILETDIMDKEEIKDIII